MPSPDRPGPQPIPPRRRVSRRAIAGARRQDGQTLVITAVLLTLLFGMLALSIDLGSMYVGQRQAQSASDAGALAAAEDLPLNSNTTEAALAAKAAHDATTYALDDNDPNGSATSSTPVGGSGCTSPSYDSTNPSLWAECFEARVGVSQTTPLTFEGLVGSKTGTVSATAVATVNLTPSASGGNLLVPNDNGNFPTACTTTQSDPTFCEAGVPGTAGSTIGTTGAPWTVWYGNVDWAAYVSANKAAARYVSSIYSGPPNDPTANVIDMNGNQDGGIYQTVTGLVTTPPNNKYLLSFYLSGNDGHSEPTFTGTVGIAPGATVPSATPASSTASTPPTTTAVPTELCPSPTICVNFSHTDSPANSMTWDQVGIPFTATSTSMTISFLSTSSQTSNNNLNTGPTLADVGVQPATYSLTQ